ncbi:MAG: ABC transporter permease [Acidimicrobiia bacterium]|nr:MAG: ABC transporter permease [Acidimicrobiia bacterium]
MTDTAPEVVPAPAAIGDHVSIAGLGSDDAAGSARLALRRFLRHRVALAALGVLLVMVALSVFVNLYYEHSYSEITTELSKPPSTNHWFGTDELGKDVYAKTMRGAQKSLQIGLVSALIATVAGVIVGAVAGYYRGWLDTALMRVTDLFLTLPALAVLLVLANRYREQSGNWFMIALVIAVFAWMYQARITRSEILTLSQREYVAAARAVGASDARIIVRHLLPNALGSIIVNATLTVATVILVESSLSFLGFGVAPPDTSLGRLVEEGAQASRTRPWLFYPPGLWLVLLLLCINFVGDGLRDAFDPKHEGSGGRA